MPSIVDDEWISRLEGPWRGEMTGGPRGDYDDFEMSFVRNDDGSMEANVILPNGSTMDFRFMLVDDIWEMREGVAAIGGGQHSNRRMSQLWREGNRVRWVWDDEEPEDAWTDIIATDDSLVWEVYTRACGHAPGEMHVLIDVTRP